MKTLVVIPTYNEAANIVSLISEIRGARPGLHVLVVDDNSPDGTAGLVEKLGESHPGEVHCLKRPGKQGLGRAYVAGFGWGLDRGYEVVVEMDADFSHRPVDLVKVLEAANSHDFVVGSRWIKGGSTLNWSIWRKLISIGGSFYSRLILGYPLRDWTGGFNAWRAVVLQGIGLDEVKSEGYSFQIELKFRACSCGFKGTEVPIIFDERREGQSKMSSRIVLEALYRVWLIRFKPLAQKAG
ncbi:MAG: polyprenol monophosphomannose synthase [Bdellovibrionaceae bacterium]|nr:polyprenol monophosphomannose synthase [Bdellovibrionales bacterium]MCB9082882.1 polyprenol monophosphomannose synthase [Pseudobdellovibrionaceae bacterium]